MNWTQGSTSWNRSLSHCRGLPAPAPWIVGLAVGHKNPASYSYPEVHLRSGYVHSGLLSPGPNKFLLFVSYRWVSVLQFANDGSCDMQLLFSPYLESFFCICITTGSKVLSVTRSPSSDMPATIQHVGPPNPCRQQLVHLLSPEMSCKLAAVSLF